MKYFFGFLVCVGLIVLVVVLIIRGFAGDTNKPVPTPLVSYASTATEVRLTVGGPIVGDQQFRSYNITTGRDQVVLKTTSGYENNVLTTLTYDNNQQAYANFLRALDFAGFTRGKKESPQKDERGTCANGSRYILEILNGSNQIQRFWTTSCKGQGNFTGNVAEIRRLFNKQIPQAEYTKAVRGFNL